MTLRMKMKLNSKQWAAVVRGVLAVAVAVITSVVAGLTGSVATPILTLTAILQGLIALRSFIDGSAERAKGSETEPQATDSAQQILGPQTKSVQPQPSWLKTPQTPTTGR